MASSATLLTEKYAAATERWLANNFIPQFLKGSPFMEYMASKNRILTGGWALKVPVAHTAPTNVGVISDPRADLTIAGPMGENATYTWSLYGALAAIDETEKMETSGEVNQIKLLANRVRLVADYCRECMLNDLFDLSQTSGGVLSLFDVLTENTNSVGGIDVTDNPLWIADINAETHATDPISAATIETDITNSEVAILKKGGKADLCLMSPSVWGKFHAERVARGYLRPAENRTMAGYHAIETESGVTCVMEPHMEEQGAGDTNYRGWMVLMDTRENYLVLSDKKPRMKQTEADKALWEGYKIFFWASMVFGALNRCSINTYQDVSAG